MILDINKQLDEILKEELLQAEVITTECGKIMRFPNNGCEKIGGCIINYKAISLMIDGRNVILSIKQAYAKIIAV